MFVQTVVYPIYTPFERYMVVQHFCLISHFVRFNDYFFCLNIHCAQIMDKQQVNLCYYLAFRITLTLSMICLLSPVASLLRIQQLDPIILPSLYYLSYIRTPNSPALTSSLVQVVHIKTVSE